MIPGEKTEKEMSQCQHRQAWTKLTQRYLADLPKQLQAMRGCLDRGDLVQLQQQAHRAKGTSGTYRLERIAEEFALLEDLARRGAAREIPPHLDRLAVLVGEAESRCRHD